jgi:transcriptional regulator with XRE-family HTH domain
VNTLFEVWNKFRQGKQYRSAFARAQFKRLVPFQIEVLRKQRGWSQYELAERAHLTQGVISRAEDQDYGNLTVNTILSIADGFDVAFVGKFVPFSELDGWYVNLSAKNMHVPSFDQENEVMVAAEESVNVQDTHLTAVDLRLTNEAPTDKALEALKGTRQSPLDARLIDLCAAQSKGGLANAAICHSPR